MCVSSMSRDLEMVAVEQRSSCEMDSHWFDLGKHQCKRDPAGYWARTVLGSSLKETEVVPGLGFLLTFQRKEN